MKKAIKTGVTVSFDLDTLDEIEQIAVEREWSRNKALEKFCLLGLDAYRQSQSAINMERLGARLAGHNLAIERVQKNAASA